MSKKTNEFFDQLKAGKESSFLETLRDAAAAVKEGAGQLWDGAKPMFDHGRTELAAALFAGHGHVMYMKGMYNNGHELGQENSEIGKGLPEREQETGREM